MGATTWSYAYDAANRLTLVKLNGNEHIRYYYDANGRRIKLWDSQTGTLTFAYSGLNVIYESPSNTSTSMPKGLTSIRS